MDTRARLDPGRVRARVGRSVCRTPQEATTGLRGRSDALRGPALDLERALDPHLNLPLCRRGARRSGSRRHEEPQQSRNNFVACSQTPAGRDGARSGLGDDHVHAPGAADGERWRQGTWRLSPRPVLGPSKARTCPGVSDSGSGAGPGRDAAARAATVIRAFLCIGWRPPLVCRVKSVTRATRGGRSTLAGRFSLRSISSRGGSELGTGCPAPTTASGLVGADMPGNDIATSVCWRHLM
jgi:hypothetical protein